MAHLRFLSILFLITSPLMVSAQTGTETSIKVTSIESQQGKVLAQTTKQGVPGIHKQLAKSLSANSANSKAQRHQAKQQATPLAKPFSPDQRSLANNPDFWIYDAFVSLNQDPDFDGYYSTFTVEFDADTIYTEAEVYARLYLTRGSVFEEYHTTSLFWINGENSHDSLIVESSLVSGFPPGDYEVLIELYDSLDNSLVAVYDGFSDADLTLLPLESKTFEEQETVVVVTEHGGSFAWLLLLLVPVLVRRFSAQQS